MCQKRNTNKILLLGHILYSSSKFINGSKGNLSRNCLKHFVFIILFDSVCQFFLGPSELKVTLNPRAGGFGNMFPCQFPGATTMLLEMSQQDGCLESGFIHSTFKDNIRLKSANFS